MATAALKRHFDHWIERRHGTHSNAIELDRRHIYILPTSHGYAFCAVLLIMLLWSINYSNSLSFVLTFLLGAVALNAMWRTRNNLLDLKISPGVAEPVFAGQQATFRFRLEQPDRQIRYGIGVHWSDQAPHYCDVAGGAPTTAIAALPAPGRGRLQPGRLRIVTRFPLGLFQAWSWVSFDNSCLVYPAPGGEQTLPQAQAIPRLPHGGAVSAAGNDDYAGLRQYIAGDSPRHIAWRASARGDDLLVKRFAGLARTEQWLEWDAVEAAGTEAKLAQLCRWVLAADADAGSYGLRLPSTELAPAFGDRHRRVCLQTLALYDEAV